MRQPKREETCAFTGHRPEALPWGTWEDDPRCVALKARLAEAIERAYHDGYRHFACGMARGADLYFCEAALAARERHSDISVEGAVPYPQQSAYWPPEEQRRYRELLDQCDMESLIQQQYSEGCLFRRNLYLVNHASRIIAVFNGDLKRGGTASTLRYAVGQGLETDILSV